MYKISADIIEANGLLNPHQCVVVLEEDFDVQPGKVDLVLSDPCVMSVETLWSENSLLLYWYQISALRDASKLSSKVG